MDVTAGLPDPENGNIKLKTLRDVAASDKFRRSIAITAKTVAHAEVDQG